MKFIIKGNPITKKNSNRIVKFGARYALIPSKQYKEYEQDFIIQCMQYKIGKLMIDRPVEITCNYYMGTRRKVDLTNLLSATMDCLVKAQIIEDDNCKIAVSNDGSRVFYDKENPRVEIEIKPSDFKTNF